MSLQQTLSMLATTFADQILEAIQSSSLEELTGGARPKANGAHTNGIAKAATKSSGRLARRSMEDIQKILDNICALLSKKPEGLRAEDIRAALKLEAREMPRVLKEGITKKLLRTTGQKRATTYFLAAKGQKKKSVKTANRKASKPKPKKAASKKPKAKKAVEAKPETAAA